ncbi:ribonuclease R [Raoultella ornithinolytica]|nr:ribonuclease R [Raoultella ornithinolytica]
MRFIKCWIAPVKNAAGSPLRAKKRVFFNAERRIERIEQTQRNDAHKLIEECMILANISAARFV